MGESVTEPIESNGQMERRKTNIPEWLLLIAILNPLGRAALEKDDTGGSRDLGADVVDDTPGVLLRRVLALQDLVVIHPAGVR